MLALPGATVTGVRFEPEGMVIELRLRARLRCSCGWSTRARYDSSRRRWRHLDVGGCRLWLEADIRRLHCRRCARVVTEEVPWARPGAWHSKDFEDVAAWLAQRADKTTISSLLRCSWKAVDNIIRRVVAEHLDAARLEGLYRIGVDEISYRRGHRYLTVVADHDSGKVVWVAPGRRGQALQDFYDAIGPAGRDRIEAVSMRSVHHLHRRHPRRPAPSNHLLRPLPRNPTGQPGPQPGSLRQPSRRRWDHQRRPMARRTLRPDRWGRETRPQPTQHHQHVPAHQPPGVAGLATQRSSTRPLPQHPLRPGPPLPQSLDHRRLRSRIPAFRNLTKTIRTNFDGICAAVEEGLSNSRLEGINSKIRLIQRRGYGYHSTDALAASIYLCLGGITIQLPTHP
jgi:transposase